MVSRHGNETLVLKDHNQQEALMIFVNGTPNRLTVMNFADKRSNFTSLLFSRGLLWAL